MRLHHPIFLYTRIALQIENHTVQKNINDHGDNWITEPGSKELTKHLRSVDPWSCPKQSGHPKTLKFTLIR